MQPDIERLADLQAVDLRLNDLRAKSAAFPHLLAEIEKHASEERQQLATAKEAHANSVKDRKKYELDVESWKEKVRKYRDQSSAVKTNEAYKALQH
jgi:predicted  nucleic acid-binding Zn-ribbon protein